MHRYRQRVLQAQRAGDLGCRHLSKAVPHARHGARNPRSATTPPRRSAPHKRPVGQTPAAQGATLPRRVPAPRPGTSPPLAGEQHHSAEWSPEMPASALAARDPPSTTSPPVPRTRRPTYPARCRLSDRSRRLANLHRPGSPAAPVSSPALSARRPRGETRAGTDTGPLYRRCPVESITASIFWIREPVQVGMSQRANGLWAASRDRQQIAIGRLLGLAVGTLLEPEAPRESCECWCR